MELLSQLPVWALALLIFTLRVVDVSLGTCRTIAVVQGRITTSVMLGFVEALLWLTTVAQVIHHASGDPLLLTAYAGGFAAGNASGIALERRLALGGVILRLVSRAKADELAEALHHHAPRVYRFDGAQDDQQVSLLYVVVRRRDAPRLIDASLAIDPDAFYAVDMLRESNLAVLPTHASGWRSIAKKK